MQQKRGIRTVDTRENIRQENIIRWDMLFRKGLASAFLTQENIRYNIDTILIIALNSI